jgi:hypothetical protein
MFKHLNACSAKLAGKSLASEGTPVIQSNVVIKISGSKSTAWPAKASFAVTSGTHAVMARAVCRELGCTSESALFLGAIELRHFGTVWPS